MSKFKDFGQVFLGLNERIIFFNGPEIREIFKWHKQLKSLDPYLHEDGKSICEVLERGPIFDLYEPLVLTMSQIDMLKVWKTTAVPVNSELADKIVLAIDCAKEGKKRTDLPESNKK